MDKMYTLDNANSFITSITRHTTLEYNACQEIAMANRDYYN